jgi:hypothetical protein
MPLPMTIHISSHDGHIILRKEIVGGDITLMADDRGGDSVRILLSQDEVNKFSEALVLLQNAGKD